MNPNYQSPGFRADEFTELTKDRCPEKPDHRRAIKLISDKFHEHYGWFVESQNTPENFPDKYGEAYAAFALADVALKLAAEQLGMEE